MTFSQEISDISFEVCHHAKNGDVLYMTHFEGEHRHFSSCNFPSQPIVNKVKVEDSELLSRYGDLDKEKWRDTDGFVNYCVQSVVQLFLYLKTQGVEAFKKNNGLGADAIHSFINFISDDKLGPNNYINELEELTHMKADDFALHIVYDSREGLVKLWLIDKVNNTSSILYVVGIEYADYFNKERNVVYCMGHNLEQSHEAFHRWKEYIFTNLEYLGEINDYNYIKVNNSRRIELSQEKMSPSYNKVKHHTSQSR